MATRKGLRTGEKRLVDPHGIRRYLVIRANEPSLGGGNERQTTKTISRHHGKVHQPIHPHPDGALLLALFISSSPTTIGTTVFKQ